MQLDLKITGSCVYRQEFEQRAAGKNLKSLIAGILNIKAKYMLKKQEKSLIELTTIKKETSIFKLNKLGD